jgi:hypothetical protein
MHRLAVFVMQIMHEIDDVGVGSEPLVSRGKIRVSTTTAGRKAIDPSRGRAGVE